MVIYIYILLKKLVTNDILIIGYMYGSITYQKFNHSLSCYLQNKLLENFYLK